MGHGLGREKADCGQGPRHKFKANQRKELEVEATAALSCPVQTVQYVYVYTCKFKFGGAGHAGLVIWLSFMQVVTASTQYLYCMHCIHRTGRCGSPKAAH